ncbi:MAG: S41 family peptidase [Bacteroidales bacterium]
MPKIKYSIATRICVLCLSVVILSSAAPGKKSFDISKNLDIFNSIVKELSVFYVDSIDADKVIGNGIKSMLYSLDPYTNYIPEDKSEDFKFMTTGEYAGIGALISGRDSLIYIAELYYGNPAQTDGLKVGDKITAIDGESMIGKSTDYASNRLRGKANTTVIVKVLRPGSNEEMDISITRKKIYVPAVPYYGIIGDNTGYIYLNNFNDKAASEVKAALKELIKNNNIKSLVLDLRDNPGGILDEAIEVVNLFVPKGKTVLETRGKIDQWNKVYKTTQAPIDSTLPLAVLVSGESASASEIVSGALQDFDRAVIIGERTYGKGLVQSTRPLPYKGTLKVTTSKYYIPSGRLIQAIDYSQRNADGSVARIPDSLTNEFRTAGGRIVRDGGGITPDINIEAEKVGNIIFYLTKDMILFDYVTDYVLKHPVIPPVEEFVFSDEDYKDFKTFVKSHNFKYDRQSEKALKNLKEIAEFEGYMDEASETFATLEKQLAHNLDKDLETFRKTITNAITAEIIQRYYYTKGGIQQILKDDKYTKKSIEILSNPVEYKNIISVSKKNKK